MKSASLVSSFIILTNQLKEAIMAAKKKAAKKAVKKPAAKKKAVKKKAKKK